MAKNFAAVLQKVREGTEVVVEQDHRPVVGYFELFVGLLTELEASRDSSKQRAR